jgi:hypothetical protein
MAVTQTKHIETHVKQWFDMHVLGFYFDVVLPTPSAITFTLGKFYTNIEAV